MTRRCGRGVNWWRRSTGALMAAVESAATG